MEELVKRLKTAIRDIEWEIDDLKFYDTVVGDKKIREITRYAGLMREAVKVIENYEIAKPEPKEEE
jgi:hypothetical protein